MERLETSTRERLETSTRERLETSTSILTARAAPLPVFTTINRWGEITGMSRRVTYEELAAGNLRAVKRGASTLIDVPHGIAWLRSLPPAKIRPSRARNVAQ